MRRSGRDNGRLCLHGRQAKRRGYGRRQAITGGDIRQHGRQAAGFQAAGRAGKAAGQGGRRSGTAGGSAAGVRQAKRAGFVILSANKTTRKPTPYP